MNLSEKQRDILLHTTGLHRKPESYRNHFATDPDDEYWGSISGLVSLGLMERLYDHSGIFGGMVFFRCTALGMAEAQRLAGEKETG